MSTNDKVKKENWATEEIDVLLDEIIKRQSLLFGKLSAFVTNDRKRAHWRQVVEAVRHFVCFG